MASPPRSEPGSISLSAELQLAMQSAAAEASKRGHAVVTVEHLMWMLVREASAQALLSACGADLTELDTELDQYLDLLVQKSKAPAVDAPYERLIQRSVATVAAAGRRELGIVDLLASLPRETESYSAMLLHAAGIDRVHLLRQISHGTPDVHPVAPPGGVRHQIWFHNDDYTTMELVVRVLCEVLDRDEREAHEIMMKIHNEGAAIVAVLPADDALARALRIFAIAEETLAPLRVTLAVD